MQWKIGGAAALLLTGFALAGGPEQATPEPENPWTAGAREVLVQRCGSCHRPEQRNSDPDALAIMNLNARPWYLDVTEERLRKIAQRIDDTRSASDAERRVVADFVRCQVEGDCG